LIKRGGFHRPFPDSTYKSGPSKFWLKAKNVVESELILLGTDYDNEGKPIAYQAERPAKAAVCRNSVPDTIRGAPD
jgi:hypothetical protein